MARPESYADGGDGRAAPPLAPTGRPMPRNRSDPLLHGANALVATQTTTNRRASGVDAHDGRYPAPYDAATTGSGSGTEPWANSTDPSSENSSVDRIHQHQPGAGGALAGPSASAAGAAAAPKPPQPPPHAYQHRAPPPPQPQPQQPPPPEAVEAQDFFSAFGRTQPAPAPALAPAPAHPQPNHGARYPTGPPPPPAHSQPSRGGPTYGNQAPAAAAARGPNGQGMRPAHAPQSAPRLPPKDGAAPAARGGTLLRKSPDKAPAVTVKAAEQGEKRKSWLKRTFGKGS